MPKYPNYLRRFCRRKGMTQRDLARQLGVSPEWLSRVARGVGASSEPLERRIAFILELTSDEYNQCFHLPHRDLFERKEEREPHILHLPGR